MDSVAGGTKLATKIKDLLNVIDCRRLQLPSTSIAVDFSRRKRKLTPF
jgi:hypothetical protein